MKLLLTVDEAGASLGLKHSKIYEILASGALPSIKIGKSRRIPLQALEEFVQRLVSEQVEGEKCPGE